MVDQETTEIHRKVFSLVCYRIINAVLTIAYWHISILYSVDFYLLLLLIVLSCMIFTFLTYLLLITFQHYIFAPSQTTSSNLSPFTIHILKYVTHINMNTN